MKGLIRSDDTARNVQAGDRARIRTCRKNDVAANDALSAYLDGVRRGQATPSLDDVNAARRKQALNASVQLINNGIAILADLCHIDSLEARLDSESVGFADGVSSLCCVQVSLGRDAATVEAGSTNLVTFDKGYFQSQLGGA